MRIRVKPQNSDDHAIITCPLSNYVGESGCETSHETE